MLISRCAWHRRYYGYTRVLGISSWRGLQPRLTDGICQKCAARVRADHLRVRVHPGASARSHDGAWLPGLAAVSLGLVVALVLIARPTHELPPLPAATALVPTAVIDEPTQEPVAVTEPTPAPGRIAVSHRVSRPVRTARRPAVHSPTRAAWYPWRLPRVSVPVSWDATPYRAVAARDNRQSP